MSKENGKLNKGKLKKSVRTGIAAGGFVTAILIVMLICFVFQVDLGTVGVGLLVVVVIVAGIPLFLFAMRDNNDIKDENATCQPILEKYRNSRNAQGLVNDYNKWVKGEHSSYSRVHFGGDVVAELRDAEEYEAALKILDSLESIDMKARERYDYENFRDAVRPELVEAIEKKELHAEERARNKNLR